MNEYHGLRKDIDDMAQAIKKILDEFESKHDTMTEHIWVRRKYTEDGLYEAEVKDIQISMAFQRKER